MTAHAILRAGLVKVLNHWVEDFKQDHLDLGFLTGNVALKDLSLRKELLTDLDAPVALKRGTIGRFCVQFGFASFTSASLKVELEDIDIVLAPLSPKELLAKEYRTAQALAQQQVEQNAKPLFRAIAASDYTALLSVAVKLVHSVSVSVKNVRIHYEDTVTVPGAPILIGLTIDSIASHTVDGWFRERALLQACDVRGVSLFMNTDRDVKKHRVTTDEDIAERLASLYEGEPHYVLSPSSLSVKLFCCPSQANVPQLLARVHANDVRLTFEQDQYSAALALGELVRGFSRRTAHKLQRPTVPVHGNTRAWWRFVVSSVQEDVRAARRQLWMRAFTRKRRERELYIALTRKHHEGRSDATDVQELRSLEANFDPTDLQELRAAATRFTDVLVPAQSNGRSSFSMQELKMLEAEFGIELPKERTESVYKFTTDGLSFTLKGEAENRPVLGIAIEALAVSLSQHQVEWRTVQLSVASFAVADYYSAPGKTVAALMPRPRETSGPLVNLKYEIHPLNRHEDFALELHVQVVDVVFSRDCIEAIVRFFLSPRYAPILELSDKARETLAAIEQTVENRIRFALLYHETASVNFLVDPPRIFFPAAFGRPTSAMVAELGPIAVEAARAINLDSLPTSGPGSELVYDIYSVTVEVRNMYLVCVPDDPASHEAPSIRKAIDRFSTTFTLHILNIDVPRLPFVKLTGSLPVIGVYVRREDLKQFATIAGELLFSDTAVVAPSNAPVKAAPRTAQENYQVLHAKDSLSHRSFRMEVSIDTVFLKVYSHANDERAASQDLFLATWKGFVLSLGISDYATEVNASLRAFYIENLVPMEGSNVQRYILRSQPYQTLDDLISVNYLGVARNAPFYNGVDNVLDINVAGIAIRVTPESVSLMLQLVDDTAAAFIAKSEEKARNALPAATASSVEAGRLSASKSSLVQMTASFGMMEVLLDQGATRIASVAISNNKVFLELYNDMGVSVEANLGVLEVHNYDPSVPAWREVVRMEKRDTSLIELKYRTLSPPKDGFEASLVAVVNNVTVVAVTSFFLKIQTILTSILDSIHPTVLPLPSFGSASANANKHWLDYRILVQNPLVIVPRNGASQREFIQLDLGRIYVYTTPASAQGASLLSLEVEDFNVRTMLPGLPAPLPLLKNTALLLRLVQSTDSLQSVDPTVRSEIPSLHISASDRQLALLLHVWNENLSIGGAFAAQAVGDEGAASTVKATLRIVHLTVELLAHPEHGPAWETEQLLSLNVGQILAEIQRTSNEVSASARMVVLEEMRAAQKPIVRTLITSRMLERDALTVRLLTPPKGDSAPPELYATVAGLQLCVLPDALHSLYAFISRFSALIAPATPPVRKPPAPREAPPLTSPLPPARLRLSVQGVLVSLPGVRVPTPESVGIVIEVHTELFLDHNKEGLRFELEVRNLIARRSGVMRLEPSATIVRPFSLRVAADLSPAEGELKGQADLGELSVLLTYSDYHLINNISSLLKEAVANPSAASDSAAQADDDAYETPDLLASLSVRQVLLQVGMESGHLTVVEDCTVCEMVQKSVSQPLARLSWRSMRGNVQTPPFALGLALFVCVKYWNARQSAWEPFLEEWQVQLELVRNAKVCGAPHDSVDPERLPVVRKPVYVTRFQLRGLSPLEFTVTRPMVSSVNLFIAACREQSKRLATIEAQGKEVGLLPPLSRRYHPWVVLNATGAPLTCAVLRDDQVTQAPRLLRVQERGALSSVEQEVYTRSQIGDVSASGVEALSVAVKLPTNEEIGCLPLGRCCLLPVPLPMGRVFIYEITFEEGHNVVRLRSNLLLHNRTKTDLLLRIVRPNAQIAHECREKYGAPLECVKDARITVAPAYGSHTWSPRVIYLDAPPAAPMLLPCVPALQGHPPYTYVARLSVAKLAHNDGTALDYRIRLSPPLVFVNMLCVPVTFRIGRGQFRTEASLRPGEKFGFHEADFAHSVWVSLKLEGYNWSAETPLHRMGEEADHIALSPESAAPSLSVNFENRTRKQGHRKVIIYTPFWIVNETSLRLQYSHTVHTFDSVHSPTYSSIDQDPFAAPLAGPIDAHPVSWSHSSLAFRVHGCPWSSLVVIDRRHQEEQAIAVPAGRHRAWNLVISETQPPRKFWRSTVLTVRFAYVLVNDSTEPLAFRQAFSNAQLVLAPGEVSSWHWRDTNTPQSLCVTKADRGALSWSSAFSLDLPKPTFDLNLWTVHNSKEMVRVQMRRSNGSTVLVFRSRPEFAQFRIENRCRGLDLILRQKGAKEERILAGTETSFAWDSPDLPVRDQLVKVYVTRGDEEPTYIGQYGFHKFKKWSNVPVAGLRGTLTVEVNASGPTRVLLVSDSRSCSPPLSRGQRELEGCVELPALGISVVDEAPQELCYISLRRISLDVLRNSIDKSVDLRVGAVQVDNSLPATAFPVLFATQAPAEKDAMPAVHVSLCKGNAYSEMSYYRYLGFAVQPCTVKFDELFVLASVNFASALYDLMGEYWKAQDFEQYANNSAKLVDPRCLTARRIFFDVLEIQALRVQVTFLTLPHLSEGGAASERSLWIERLLSHVGLLANVDGELSLRPLVLERAYGPKPVVFGLITEHFQRQAYRQWLRLIGASVLLGAPTVFWTSIAHGFRDLVAEPAKSRRSVSAFTSGVARGARSLGQHTVYGFANSTAVVTSNIARAIGKASFDKRYQANRELTQVLQRPANPLQGVVAGGTAFTRSVGAAVKGVVDVPRTQARRKGRLRPVKVAGAVGAGLLGLVVKPLAGAFDLVSLCSEGVKNFSVPFANSSDARKRIRPPRHFDETGAVQPYSLLDAAAQYLLRTAHNGRFMQQVYLYGRPIADLKWLVLSTELLLYISLRKDGTVKKVRCVSAESVLEIRASNEETLVVALSQAEAPAGRLRRGWRMLYPQRNTNTVSAFDQREPAFADSSSSLSDVMPRVSAASEWLVRGTQPMPDVAEEFRERLQLYRADRAPACQPPEVAVPWHLARNSEDFVREEKAAALETERRRAEQIKKEAAAFAAIAARCKAERTELCRQMERQRRMPAEKDTSAERPTEVLGHNRKAERKRRLEQSLTVLRRQEERLVQLIDHRQSREAYRCASFADFAPIVGVSMARVQRVDAAPVERQGGPNLLRFAHRPLPELRAALLQVRSEIVATEQALRHMEYHHHSNFAQTNQFAGAVLASVHMVHEGMSWRCLGRRAATASPIVALWLLVALLYICWKYQVWLIAP